MLGAVLQCRGGVVPDSWCSQQRVVLDVVCMLSSHYLQHEVIIHTLIHHYITPYTYGVTGRDVYKSSSVLIEVFSR